MSTTPSSSAPLQELSRSYVVAQDQALIEVGDEILDAIVDSSHIKRSYKTQGGAREVKTILSFTTQTSIFYSLHRQQQLRRLIVPRILACPFPDVVELSMMLDTPSELLRHFLTQSTGTILVTFADRIQTGCGQKSAHVKGCMRDHVKKAKDFAAALAFDIIKAAARIEEPSSEQYILPGELQLDFRGLKCGCGQQFMDIEIPSIAKRLSPALTPGKFSSLNRIKTEVLHYLPPHLAPAWFTFW